MASALGNLLDHARNPHPFLWENAPLSSVLWPTLAVPTYLATIFALQYFMQRRQPFKLKWLTALHNIFLFLLSAAMAVGTVIELVLISRKNGFFCVVCDHDHTAMTTRLGLWMYIFYVSKYYELLDTVIMCFKKKPLGFLHVYHHCIVLPLFWVYMQTGMTIHWILVIANSSVHVMMYYYYAAANFGVRVWWKEYITAAQIVQFVIDLTATWPFPFFYYSAGGCAGSMRGWIFGQLVGFSFFKLFSDFYRKAYRSEMKKGAEDTGKRDGDPADEKNQRTPQTSEETPKKIDDTDTERDLAVTKEKKL